MLPEVYYDVTLSSPVPWKVNAPTARLPNVDVMRHFSQMAVPDKGGAPFWLMSNCTESPTCSMSEGMAVTR